MLSFSGLGDASPRLSAEYCLVLLTLLPSPDWPIDSSATPFTPRYTNMPLTPWNPRPRFAAAIYYINRMTDACFMADIFIQFNTAVYDHHDTLVRHRAVIAAKYVSGSLWLDVVSTIPYDLIVEAANVTGSLKGLKALRVMKLLRLGRTLRLIAKAEQHMNVSLAYPDD